MTLPSEKALTRLNNEFAESSNLKEFIVALLTSMDETYEFIEDLKNKRHLEDAEGVWLDRVGKIVGIERPLEEIDDTEYFEFGTSDDPDDPTQNEMYSVGEALSGSGYTKGYHANNGNIYFLPYDNGDQFMRYKESTESWHKIGSEINGFGSPLFEEYVIGPDDMMYALPAGLLDLYRIDPSTNEVEVVATASTFYPWSKGYVSGDKIIFIPNVGETFATYDTSTGEFVEAFGDPLPPGNFKTRCASFNSNGAYLYVTPDDVDVVNRFIKLYVDTGEWEYVGDPITKWSASYSRLFSDCVPRPTNAKMYLIPNTNNRFVKFDMTAENWTAVGADLTTIYNPANGAFAEAGIYYGGDVFAIPYEADSYVRWDLGTDTWSQVADLTKPRSRINARGYIYDEDLDKIAGYSTFYHEVWELDLATLSSLFTDAVSGVFNNGAFAGPLSGAVFTGYTGTNLLQKYVPNYNRGFSDVNQLEGGKLRGVDGTWLDGTTMLGDVDYRNLINAKATVSFLDSTLYATALYINEAFEVTGKVDIREDSDWEITLDSYLGSKERRYLLIYAPVPAGSDISIKE